jgi:hypothetical protein
MPRPVDFQKIALVMAEAAKAGRPVGGTLRRRCPAISHQIETDRGSRTLFRLWGRTLNEDELARQTIVHPAILKAIGDLAGVACEGNIIHAGLEHTYGYLFSTIETPFGFKRDRWVKPAIENGFQLTQPTLRPKPTEGTLLANLTYFLGRMVFRGCRRELSLLRSLKDHVSQEIADAARYRSVNMLRIEETVHLRGGDIILHSDLIPFPMQTETDFALLVYWVRDFREKNAQLVTAFPTGRQFAAQILEHGTFGKRQPIQTRFNGFVDGITGHNVRGTRSKHFPGRLAFDELRTN